MHDSSVLPRDRLVRELDIADVTVAAKDGAGLLADGDLVQDGAILDDLNVALDVGMRRGTSPTCSLSSVLEDSRSYHRGIGNRWLMVLRST